MKVELFDFQREALDQLQSKLGTARQLASTNEPQAVSFSAPTGTGKTIVMSALFETVFFGEPGFDAQSDAVILWLSDMPELNEQTRLKIEGKSDRIRVRQLITIDSSFDAERLDGGYVYFMNTQKLGSEKLLTKRSDNRQFTIWETLTNTAKDVPDRFYVVIDEAHRGMRGDKAAEKAQTIMQRFLLGSVKYGLCKMPIVIGVSATPKRFEELLSGTTHTVHKVYVRADDVRESGLLKDRILIHYPDSTNQAEMTLLGEATSQWKKIETIWARYTQSQGDPNVRPILVVQVEDGTHRSLTKTDLEQTLTTIEASLNRRLKNGEVAHTFNDTGELEIGGRQIRRIEASRIEEDPSVQVVLFKMSLSTGWDCPRAEIMMSFRKAQDHTYIAQLLGRMVRTPLARRIEADVSLNDVHLFLPHYDQSTVETVIKDLRDDEFVPPSETGSSREMVALSRREGSESIFDAMSNLVTYRVNKVRKQSALKRLIGLGRGLTHDEIDYDANEEVKAKIVDRMREEIWALRSTGVFDERAKAVTGVDMSTLTIQYGTNVAETALDYRVASVTADIDRRFHQQGKLLGNGLHMDYWRSNSDQDASEVKVELIVLTQDHERMQSLEDFAQEEFNALYARHKRAFSQLKEEARKRYEKLRLATSTPQDIPWILGQTIDFRRSPTAPVYDRHLFVDKDGKFRIDLGQWESEVLKEELSDDAVVGWLRNLDRKPWSLEIPYEAEGKMLPMFPDLVIVRAVDDGYAFDILEPHDPSREDNFAKAVGLAKFADKHWAVYERIQLIRKRKASDGTDRFYRLDVGDDVVRQKVLAVTSNAQLKQIFDVDAVT